MPREISIQEFELLSVHDRRGFVDGGGVVVGTSPLGRSIPRSEFNKLIEEDRRKFIKAGGVVEDPAAAPKGPRIADPALITRTEFQAMSPIERSAAVRAGRRVVDGHRAAPPTGTE